MGPLQICRELNDEELLKSFEKIVWAERKLLAVAIAHLVEVDRRKLHEEEAYSSLFDFCIRKWKWSEAVAYKRIQAVRVVREYPIFLEWVERGRIHLSALLIIRPHLTQENHLKLLEDASGKTKREVERIAAEISPRLDKPDRIQRISQKVVDKILPPAEAGSGEKAADPPSPLPSEKPNQKIEFLSPERIYFGFTSSEKLRQEIERLRELLRHKFPDGKLEKIIKEVVAFYLEKKDPDRRTERLHEQSQDSSPVSARKRSRYIPQRVKNEVWQRDDGQCTFLSRNGVRCSERGGLEFDHIVPWAIGGTSDAVGNIRLLCRTHNLNAARKIFSERS